MEWNCEKYCIESHEITTEDGYILSVLRVMQKRKPEIKQVPYENEIDCTHPPGEAGISDQKKRPVLMVHGFLESADHWFANEEPEICLRKSCLVDEENHIWQKHS
jgi:pimeloyl-ACP methyl ester carboxylesterase